MLSRTRSGSRPEAPSCTICLYQTDKLDIPLTRRLGAQLAELGYPPSKIKYIALSHYHYDHTANANSFADSTWLVRAVERNAMFALPAPGTTRPDTYARLKDAKTILIETDQYDVFGDGSTVIKFAPGHTPGHQMLLVRLTNTGPVLLSGDLFITFHRKKPSTDFPYSSLTKNRPAAVELKSTTS